LGSQSGATHEHFNPNPEPEKENLKHEALDESTIEGTKETRQKKTDAGNVNASYARAQ